MTTRRPRRSRTTCLAVLLCAWAAPAAALAQAVGDEGESCEVDAHCRADLRCLSGVCAAPQAGGPGEEQAEPVQPHAAGEPCGARRDCQSGLRCLESVCVEPSPEPSPPARAALTPGPSPRGEGSHRRGRGEGPWRSFELGGRHGFVGFALGTGVTGFWPFGGPVRAEVPVYAAVRGGVLLGRLELALEVAPATWIWDPDPARYTVAVSATAGYLVRLVGPLSWALRGGLGVAANDVPAAGALLQARLDPIGLVYQLGHLLLELSLASTRFHTDAQHNGIWAWLFDLTVSYVF